MPGSSLGPYKIVKVVNCDPLTGAHIKAAGVLSVVFHAIEASTNAEVAIKFFDPDIQGLTPTVQFRQNLFIREADILKSLVGNPRHLQLVQELDAFTFTVTGAGGAALSITVNYFVTEWIEYDILNYFFNSAGKSTVEKLQLFRNICLSGRCQHTFRLITSFKQLV